MASSSASSSSSSSLSTYSPRNRSRFGDTTFTKVFVGGLAWETPTEELRRYFEQFGEILEAVIITDKITGRSKGYGFVTFRESESATRSVADPNPVIDGRRANCNIASAGKPRPSPRQGRRQDESTYPQSSTLLLSGIWPTHLHMDINKLPPTMKSYMDRPHLLLLLTVHPHTAFSQQTARAGFPSPAQGRGPPYVEYPAPHIPISTPTPPHGTQNTTAGSQAPQQPSTAEANTDDQEA
ncbi:uncharacterized protein LOC103978041 isoform X2 [Musa acuminata AAA Group]|uniref:uncharacterized protein LOC135606412 isoform X2 n=1 Tax=Musa acuminata AAA Group TaxID=214697 RepID=UPI0031E00A35